MRSPKQIFVDITHEQISNNQMEIYNGAITDSIPLYTGVIAHACKDARGIFVLNLKHK